MQKLSFRRSLRVRSVLAAASFSACGLLIGGVTAGCDQQEAIRSYESPKDPSAAVPAEAQSPAAAATPAEPAAPAAKPAAAGEPTWTVPDGWKEVAGGSSMRYATFAVSEKDPSVQLTVIPLPPPQPLVENVQRWEGQVGLTPSPAEKVKEIVKTVDLGGDEASVVDLAGPGATPGGPKTRMLAAIVDRGQRVWFFKLMGPEEVVAAQKDKFDAFIKSIRFGGAQGAAPQSPVAPSGRLATLIAAPLLAVAEEVLPMAPAIPTQAANDGPQITKYKAPEGWEEDKTPRMMRVMTFFVKEGGKQAEVSVLKLGKDNIGPLLANINRWRAQVGAPPVAEVNEKEIPKVTIAGQEAYFFEFAGPNEKEPTKRMLLTMGVRGDLVFFFKMTGDAELVVAQKDKFTEFLKTVEFDK